MIRYKSQDREAVLSALYNSLELKSFKLIFAVCLLIGLNSNRAFDHFLLLVVLQVCTATAKVVQPHLCLLKMIWIPFAITRANNHNVKKSLSNLVFRRPFHLNSMDRLEENSSSEKTGCVVVHQGLSIRQVMEMVCLSKWNLKLFQNLASIARASRVKSIRKQ